MDTMVKRQVLEKSLKIRYSDMDYDLMLKYSSILHFFEDIASESAQNLGFGYTFVTENNLAWFLLKYHIEFYSYPKDIKELNIKTEPRGYNKIFAFRDFELINDKETFARAISQWSMVDLKNKNIVPVSKVLSDSEYMDFFEKRENDLSFKKIIPPNKFDKEKIYEVRYDDIDVNGHANNSNYIIWAFEPLDFEFRKSKRLKSIDMVFKKEVKYSSKIISQIEIKNNETNHILKSLDTKEDLCLINAIWCDK